MKLSMIILAFCKNCTWEILPMLIGAWLLGWLFWYLLNKPKYQNEIKQLNSNIGSLQATTTASNLAANVPNEEIQRLSDELNAAQKLNQDFNAQLGNLRSELDSSQQNSLDYKTEFKSINDELASTKNSNTELSSQLGKLNALLSETNSKNADLAQLLKNSETEIEALKAKINATPPSIDYNDDLSYTNQNVAADIEEVEEVEEEDTKDGKRNYDRNNVQIFSEDLKPKVSYANLLDSTDLKIVEGVGPKIESLMKAAGIKNWADLANTAPSTVQSILNEAGPRYRVHDPKTWPLQARLAEKDDWEALISLQKEMGGGKVGTKDKGQRSKVEKLVMKAKGIKAFAPDDLKIVEGIGPKIEELLKADGINTWVDLAASEPTRIKTVLTAAGDRYRLADPTTWPKQAGLAAKGDWEVLKAYQNRLKGGIE